MWAFLICSIVFMAVLWVISPEAMRDAGGRFDAAGRFIAWGDDFFDARNKPARDKVLHFVCGALALLVGVLVFQSSVIAAWFITLVVGAVGWELAEWHPRKPYERNRPGKFSWKDIVAGMLGASAMGLLIDLVRLAL